MEGKIDSFGVLHIKRKEKFKPQVCPFSKQKGNCGDWCPRFKEMKMEATAGIKKELVVFVCDATQKIVIKIDERE